MEEREKEVRMQVVELYLIRESMRVRRYLYLRITA